LTVTQPPTTPPTVTLTQTPPAVTQNTSATFAWTTTGQIASTTCELDGVPQSCSSPRTYTNLAVGVHIFRVTVSNAGGSDTDTFTWEIQPPPPGDPLCDKIVQVFGYNPVSFTVNRATEITLAGVVATNCPGPGWNRSFLLPAGGTVSAPPFAACPNLILHRDVQNTQPCGSALTFDEIYWEVRRNTGLFGELPPILRVTFNIVGVGFSRVYTFMVHGAAVEPKLDQLLATGQCQLPFYSQSAPSTGPNFDITNATCTLRVF
jgi:hypothetical protein